MKLRIASRAGMIRAGVLLGTVAAVCGVVYAVCIRMPGRSYAGAHPVLTLSELAEASAMRGDVEVLALRIADRSFENHALLTSAGNFVRSRFEDAGYDVEEQRYEVDGRSYFNVVAEIEGATRPGEIVVLGAHYDSFLGAGADDNASGTAVLLSLARRLHGSKPQRTVRFVAFTNEEPPNFWTENMGSLVYARACRAKDEDVVAMLSLESLGVFSQERGSQHYPRPFSLLYPDTGNFVGFVGNVSSRDLTRRVVGTFRAHARIPSEGAALPAARVIAGKPVGLQGIDWSDHWSFWQVGYPALMVTDTAVFRNVNYHSGADTPEKLDYERMVLVEEGLAAVVSELAGIREPG